MRRAPPHYFCAGARENGHDNMKRRKMGCTLSNATSAGEEEEEEATCVVCTEVIPRRSREKMRKVASYPSLLGCPDHPCHASCLRLQLVYAPLQGWCSRQVHDSRIRCGVCRAAFTSEMLGADASLLLPWQQDVARMDQALLEFVSTEFDEDSRSMQHAELRKSKGLNYHFCNLSLIHI